MDLKRFAQFSIIFQHAHAHQEQQEMLLSTVTLFVSMKILLKVTLATHHHVRLGLFVVVQEVPLSASALLDIMEILTNVVAIQNALSILTVH